MLFGEYQLNLTVSHYLSKREREQILSIWNVEYPVSVHYKNLEEFDAYLAKQEEPRHYLMTDQNGNVVAWQGVFSREGARWLAILIDHKYHVLGVGRKLIRMAQADEKILNIWVVDREDRLLPSGEIYRSPIRFYEKLGFVQIPEIRLDNERLSAVKMQWEL